MMFWVARRNNKNERFEPRTRLEKLGFDVEEVRC
jgi:hypothetical protein